MENVPTIVLNILYIKEKEICPVYISKVNLNCEKQNNSINDSKWRKGRLALFYSKKTIGVVRGINQ